MKLSDALLPMLPGGTGVLAFVGAGGKTSALFRLARERAPRPLLLTTTTHIFDPRRSPGLEGKLVLEPRLEWPFDGGPIPPAGPGLTVLASREADTPGKIKGIHPSWLPALRGAWDLILVEADGSRRLPVKAPGPQEPVLPPGEVPVVGLVGLDGLGRPLDGATVHRPERFAEITGCAPGEPIRWAHLAALAAHPQGLFKDARGPRAILLNKADLAGALPSQAQLAALPAERVLLCSLAASEPVILCLREGAPCP